MPNFAFHAETPIVLLKYSINGGSMATVNFSVPDDVKEAFNQAFQGENKSAVLTRLMRQAVEERIRQTRRQRVIEEILKLRKETPAVSDKDIRRARTTGRP
ncbi:MAG: hypothetical protein U9R74_20545 [Pseudomonadota bacterium]|nr:hypothetical protein [Pseudomonadota bacterium]